MAYADLTICDGNPIKRWLQHRRFSDAVAILEGTTARPRILDFGAADGELTRHIRSIVPAEVVVYEPTDSLMAEARRKLAGMEGVELTKSVALLE